MPQTQRDRCRQNGEDIVPGQKFSNRVPHLMSLRGTVGWGEGTHSTEGRGEFAQASTPGLSLPRNPHPPSSSVDFSSFLGRFIWTARSVAEKVSKPLVVSNFYI